MIFETSMCSNNFEAIHLREMGLKVNALDLEPFLYIGTTSALLQSSGTTPVSRDTLDITVRMGDISWCRSLRILGGI